MYKLQDLQIFQAFFPEEDLKTKQINEASFSFYTLRDKLFETVKNAEKQSDLELLIITYNKKIKEFVFPDGTKLLIKSDSRFRVDELIKEIRGF